jgi:hypothetical protein
MVKRILFISLIVLLLCSFSQAFEPSILSGEKTSSALIYTVVRGTKCYIKAIKVVTDGTNAGKAIVYDGTDATGTVIDETTVIGTNHWGGRTWPDGGIINTGIYVAISGSGASYFVEYFLR